MHIYGVLWWYEIQRRETPDGTLKAVGNKVISVKNIKFYYKRLKNSSQFVQWSINTIKNHHIENDIQYYELEQGTLGWSRVDMDPNNKGSPSDSQHVSEMQGRFLHQGEQREKSKIVVYSCLASRNGK